MPSRWQANLLTQKANSLTGEVTESKVKWLKVKSHRWFLNSFTATGNLIWPRVNATGDNSQPFPLTAVGNFCRRSYLVTDFAWHKQIQSREGCGIWSKKSGSERVNHMEVCINHSANLLYHRCLQLDFTAGDWTSHPVDASARWVYDMSTKCIYYVYDIVRAAACYRKYGVVFRGGMTLSESGTARNSFASRSSVSLIASIAAMLPQR